MAFTFPADKADFTAPNGITYSWDATDEKWVVKAYKTTGDGADLDDYVTTEEFTTDQKRQDDLLDDYVTTEEFTTDQKRQDDLVEVGFDTQSHLLMDVIEIKDEQGVQNDQINALETQIQLLSGVKAVGKWTYRRRVESSAPRPPATATFYGTHKDGVDNVLLSWSDTYLLMISKTDIDGNNYTFSDFEEGDKVEIIATDGSSAVYGTITNNPSNDVYGNMIIDVERFRGGPVEEKEYLISAYRPGSSSPEVDLDILDGRYVNRTGSDMVGSAYLNFTGGGLKFLNSDDDTTKSFFYNASADISQWTAYNGSQIKITARDGDPGGGRTYIDIKTNDSTGIEGEDSGYRMKLFHVATPTEDYHGANKKYVDDAEARLSEQIEGIDSSQDIIVPGSAHRPPGLRFSYVSGSGSVSNGQFKWYDSNGRKLKISATSHDFPWGTDSPTGDISYSEAHLFHIYATVTDSNTGQERWRIKTTGSFNRMDWHANDILLYVPYHLMNGSFSESAAYYITLAGVF